MNLRQYPTISKKPQRIFFVVGKGSFEILSSISGSMATPSFDTMCPTIFSSQKPIMVFSKLNVTPKPIVILSGLNVTPKPIVILSGLNVTP